MKLNSNLITKIYSLNSPHPIPLPKGEGIEQKAFTLVELIVVITIIAILSTIGFVAYSGFSSKARDSSRLAQLKSINGALDSYTTRGKLPLPDDKVTIYASGTIIGYQGNAGEAVLNKIGIKEGGKDPSDDKYYTYAIDSKLKNIELLAFLENDLNEDKETSFRHLEFISGSIMQGFTTKQYIKDPEINSGGKHSEMENEEKQELATILPPFVKGARGFLFLNNDNLSKQSSRDSSTLLGMTNNNEGQKYVIASETKQSSEHSYNDKTILSGLPHYVRNDKKISKVLSLTTISSANATDYTSRIARPYGSKLGILLDSSSNPIQENTTLKTTGLDLVTMSGTYTVVFATNFKITGTGALETALISINNGGNGPGEPTICPTNYIKVPGNLEFNQPGFCVSKYEMTYTNMTNDPSNAGRNTYSYATTGNNGYIGSAQGYPIASITQTGAIAACQNLGAGYHLITNNEWMTIARNIEEQSDNWNTKTVGTGYI